MSAVAIANNNISIIAWRPTAPIPNCFGFAIYRVDSKTNQKTVLKSWIGFESDSNKEWKSRSTEDWPIQELVWGDFTAKNEAGKNSFHYEIVPMCEQEGKLVPKSDSTLVTNTVSLSTKCGNFNAYFNNGILSTQFLSHQLSKSNSGEPSYIDLGTHIKKQGDPLRKKLGGDILDGMKELLSRAQNNGGECYCALYELTDTELIDTLSKPYVHLILSNANTTKNKEVIYDGENAPVREILANVDGLEITNRYLEGSRIGHNKFVVYVDKDGPQAVLTGSTNWTPSAICGQSNNAIIIESPEIALAFLEYWKNLREDTINNQLTKLPQTGNENSNVQGQDLRNINANPKPFVLDDSTNATFWFSPNTSQTSKPSKIPLPSFDDFSSIMDRRGSSVDRTPNDIKNVFGVMKSAKQAILFLAFNPGTPSIIDVAAMCEDANPDLFVCGAVSDKKIVEDHLTNLYYGTTKPPKEVPSDVKFNDDGEVVFASAISDDFSYWHKELLKTSPTAHAIIHDKIVVVDPFSSNCAVITGSHNLGYKASYENDENLLIIRGNRPLAESYAAHVMDVYRHYRWRYKVNTKGKEKAFHSLVEQDSWQDDYYDKRSLKKKELDFWLSQ